MILVTGGTGLVGAHLLLELVRAGNHVRAIHRKGSDLERVKKVFGFYGDRDVRSNHGRTRENIDPFENGAKDSDTPKEKNIAQGKISTEREPDTAGKESAALFDRIEWVEADINDIPALEKAFKGVTHLYHAAALISFDPADYKKLQKVNAEGTANIVNLCIANKVQKLCYVSTIGAIGKTFDGKQATEETPWTPREANVYGLSKHTAEMEVWRGSQEGLDMVTVNPGVIIGPGFWDSGSGALFSTAQNTYGFYPPGGTGFISVHDVVDMMVRLMESPIKNERYIAVAENWTYRKILTEVTTELGLKPPQKRLKFWQLEIGRRFDWLGNLIFNNGRTITKSHIRSLKHRQIFDNSKIQKELDFEFRPLQDEIQFCCTLFEDRKPQ